MSFLLRISTKTCLALSLSTGLTLGLVSNFAFAQQDFSKVEIKTTQLSDSVYMMTGAGGNLGVSIGNDGVFLIDDQFAPLSEKISKAIAALSDKPVTYVLNTHWHGDHTGGNENFGSGGAVIVSHENVRKRLSTKQFMVAFGREVPAAPDTALPVITFATDATFHFNDTEIQITYLADAHTDGDSAVYFKESNILHMGDTFFNGFYPFIDQSGGGSLAGLIKAAETALEIADDNTQIIPGHGPLATKADLLNYHEMLQKVQATMQPLLKSDTSKEDLIASNPLAELNEEWGNGFMKPEVFTGILYDLAHSE